MLFVHLLVVDVGVILVKLAQVRLRHLIRSEIAYVQVSLVREGDDEARFPLEGRTGHEDWQSLQLRGPDHLNIFVNHKIARKASKESHEPRRRRSSADQRLSWRAKLLKLVYGILCGLLRV